MPKNLKEFEEKLKKEYPNNPGAVYGTLNRMGLMKGNQVTEKGKNFGKKKKMAERMSK